METITQGASGPVAVVGKSDGPYWGAFGASEAALSVLNYSGQGRTDQGMYSHFIRDSIERRSDAQELRAEIRELKAEMRSFRQPQVDNSGINEKLLTALLDAVKKP